LATLRMPFRKLRAFLSIGFGFVVIGLGGVVTAINTVSSILKRRLADSGMSPPAEPKKSWQDRPWNGAKRMTAEADRLLAKARRSEADDFLAEVAADCPKRRAGGFLDT